MTIEPDETPEFLVVALENGLACVRVGAGVELPLLTAVSPILRLGTDDGAWDCIGVGFGVPWRPLDWLPFTMGGVNAVPWVPVCGVAETEGAGEGAVNGLLCVWALPAGIRRTSGESALASVVSFEYPPPCGRDVPEERIVSVPDAFLVINGTSEAFATGAAAKAAALVACNELPVAAWCCIWGFTATMAEPLLVR